MIPCWVRAHGFSGRAVGQAAVDNPPFVNQPILRVAKHRFADSVAGGVPPLGIVVMAKVLGKLGNSGNSDAPHLHFQLMDGPSPLGAEGVPHALAAFVDHGQAKDPAILEGTGAWTPAGAAVPRKAEFPLDNAVVDLSGR